MLHDLQALLAHAYTHMQYLVFLQITTYLASDNYVILEHFFLKQGQCSVGLSYGLVKQHTKLN